MGSYKTKTNIRNHFTTGISITRTMKSLLEASKTATELLFYETIKCQTTFALREYY